MLGVSETATVTISVMGLELATERFGLDAEAMRVRIAWKGTPARLACDARGQGEGVTTATHNSPRYPVTKQLPPLRVRVVVMWNGRIFKAARVHHPRSKKLCWVTERKSDFSEMYLPPKGRKADTWDENPQWWQPEKPEEWKRRCRRRYGSMACPLMVSWPTSAAARVAGARRPCSTSCAMTSPGGGKSIPTRQGSSTSPLAW